MAFNENISLMQTREKLTFSVIYSADPDNPYKVECQGSFTKISLLIIFDKNKNI